MAKQKGERVTIYDIAARLGVSTSTVSRVLSNKNYPVSAELESSIRKVAAEMNYYPNLSARNLKKQNSRHVGIVIPSIANPYYSSVLRGIEDVAYENGYSLFICSGDRNADREQRYLKLLIENYVCGVIAIFCDPLTDGLSGYLKQGGAVLSVGTEKPNQSDICALTFDKEWEGRAATQHLIGLGHRRIAFLTAPLTNPIRRHKVNGYLGALKEAGILEEENFLTVAGKEMDVDYFDRIADCQVGIELTRKLLVDHPEVTAILCMNDLVALGCISELSDQGMKVPEDYSVMGFDDSFFSGLMKPRITTMASDKYRVGQMAMEKFINILEKKSEIRQYDVTGYVRLCVRESTNKPRSRFASQ